MRLIFIDDIASPDAISCVDTDDLLAALKEHYGGEWPEHARLYHEELADSHEVTPRTPDDVKRLAELDGVFYSVLYPGADGGLIPALIIAVVALVAAIVFTPKPKIPSNAARNQNQSSANNALSGRSNEPRPQQRVPDIYGTVRSTPDLISVPYSEFINNVEVENMTLCIGRGTYEIHDMYDGETMLDFVSGASAEVYRPHTDIYAAEPYYRVGPAIGDFPYMAVRSNSINGQTLTPADQQVFYASGDIYFEYPNRVRLVTPGSRDFTKYFMDGEDIVIATAESELTTEQVYMERSYEADPYKLRINNPSAELVEKMSKASGIHIVSLTLSVSQRRWIVVKEGDSSRGRYGSVTLGTHNLAGRYPFTAAPYVENNVLIIPVGDVNVNWVMLQNNLRRSNVSAQSHGIMQAYIYSPDFISYGGRYQIQAVQPDALFLVNPGDYNEAWRELENEPGGKSAPIYGSIYTDVSRWSDTFVFENPDTTEVWCNFVAPNGLYKDNGQNQYAANVTVDLLLTPIDENNEESGDSELFTATLYGSSVDREQKAITLKAVPSFKGRCRGRARRVTPADKSFEGTVMDEVKFRDAYSMAPFPFTDFGDFTIVRARTVATTGALALKERKLNCEVTRMLPRRIQGAEFTAQLYPTRNFADILSHAGLDPYIGNRAAAEIDFDNIYETAGQIASYFGTPKAAEFCYTFDDSNTSYEETVGMICGAVFCEAYRRGPQLKVFFEKETDMAALLFNHRNKIPDSETRTVSFGFSNDNDGLEYSYVSPEDDAVVTLYIPEDRSAVSPAKVESVGVRNREQAHLNAWRIWQKLRYGHVSAEFDATAEASLLVVNQKVLCADNTRTAAIDGEVAGQRGLAVYAAQALNLAPGVSYTAFLQLSNGTVQAIPISPGPDEYSFTLAHAPSLPLVFERGKYARTTFIIAGNELEQSGLAFMVKEKTPNNDGTVSIKAGNYDSRFYAHDRDFVKSAAGAEG